MTKIFKHPQSPDELYDSNFEDIYKLNIDKAWYWYEIGYYCGSGSILMKRGNLWCLDSLSHCSCYGPTEHLSFDGVPLEEFRSKHSQGLMNDGLLLLKMARIKI